MSKSNYPKNKLEVIVVDNNSHDGSQSFVRKNFPLVKLVRLSTNSGFAAGNNEGYKHAKGEQIVLLNSDTVVDENWLSALVTAAQDEKVGIVASKVLLKNPFLELTISSTVVQQSDLDQSTNFSPRGILLENISSSNALAQNSIWYASGFGEAHVVNGVGTRWSTGEAKILLPLLEAANNFSFVLHGYPTHNNQLLAKGLISIGKTPITHFSIEPNSVFRKTFTFDKAQYEKECVWLVQNAGNMVLKDGYSKDIGSVTRIRANSVEEFYEKDSSFFSKQREIVSACGAAMLIKRQVIEQLGFFNQYYFMYYEDIDFSLRTWKQGWSNTFAPDAIVWHEHRATTGKQESSFIVSMIEKNHLFLLLTHFPMTTFLRQYVLFLIRLASTLLKQFVFRFTQWEKYQIWSIKAAGRLDASISFHKHFFTFIKIRYFWQARELRKYNQLRQHLY